MSHERATQDLAFDRAPPNVRTQFRATTCNTGANSAKTATKRPPIETAASVRKTTATINATSTTTRIAGASTTTKPTDSALKP